MKVFQVLGILILMGSSVFAGTQGNATATERPANLTGQTSLLPDIVARSWAGEVVDIHNLQGNVVFLIFWRPPPTGC